VIMLVGLSVGPSATSFNITVNLVPIWLKLCKKLSLALPLETDQSIHGPKMHAACFS
jgi:hypothetical protein